MLCGFRKVTDLVRKKKQSLTNASSFFEQQEISREMSDWKPVRLGE